ncbi:MAG: class I SAM-dependent methyltransferase [Candidatus Sulfotelmatobacter sp.]
METLDSVNREGRNRLSPPLTNPNWLVLRRRREIFGQWLHRLGPETLDVLDVGGRLQPYRPLIDGGVRSYVSIDLRRSPLVNIIARGEQILLPSGRFDLVICTQVLEYIPDPALFVGEIERVLKRAWTNSSLRSSRNTPICYTFAMRICTTWWGSDQMRKMRGRN